MAFISPQDRLEAALSSFGPVGAAVSPATIRSYRAGVRFLLEAWARQDLVSLVDKSSQDRQTDTRMA